MEKEEILKEKARKTLNSSEMVYQKGDYDSATILYFKTLFACLDMIILENSGKVSKDHSERFRILESDFPKLYRVLDKLYPIYRNTYTSSVNKSTCEKVRENVKEIIEKQEIL